jgi:hypothetical protein
MTNAFEGYHSVAERIEKFWIHYPMGRIDSKLIFQDGTRYIVQTDLYRDVQDLIPFATDIAEEIRSNANRFPLENCVTSSIGRALHPAELVNSAKTLIGQAMRRCAGYVWKLYPICLWVKLRYRYPSNATPGRALEKLWTQLPTTWSLVRPSWMSPTANTVRWPSKTESGKPASPTKDLSAQIKTGTSNAHRGGKSEWRFRDDTPGHRRTHTH